MGKMKHIVAIILVFIILIGGGVYLLPKLIQQYSQSSSNKSSDTAVENSEQSLQQAAQDTLPFAERMEHVMEPLQTGYSKRKKRQIWTMGGGQTIITYLLQMQRFVKKNGGKTLYMEELYNLDASVFQAATVDLLDDKGDTLKIELQVSRNEYRPGASLLSVAFEVTDLTPEKIVALNKLDFPYDLLIPPFGLSDGFYNFLDNVKNKELVLWLTMESTKLNRVHNKLRPLRIHHTEEQIETVITDAMALMPNAVGIASRYGEQAVEHKQLMQAILKPAEKNHLWFLDLSTNKLSKVPQTCKDMTLSCKSATPYNPENSTLSDYTKFKMREATRNGLAVMILPLTTSALEKVQDLSVKAKSQGTSLVNLSTFMKK